MSATVFSTFAPVARAARRLLGPVTADMPRRLLGNLHHVYVRVTGDAALSGFAGGHGVIGHGHKGDGDGVVMPRQLAHFVVPPQRQFSTGANPGEYTTAAPPIAEVSMTANSAAACYHGPAGQWFSIGDFRTATAGFIVAPFWRKVRVSPGCQWVGLHVIYETVEPEGQKTIDGQPVAWVRLTSALSSSVAGDIDGGTGTTYTAAQFGAPRGLLPSGSVYAPGGGATVSGHGKLTQLVLGNVLRPLPVETYAAQLDTGLAGIAQFRGACRVTPGALNDIDVELRSARDDAFILVWGYSLFEIPLAADAPIL